MAPWRPCDATAKSWRPALAVLPTASAATVKPAMPVRTAAVKISITASTTAAATQRPVMRIPASASAAGIAARPAMSTTPHYRTCNCGVQVPGHAQFTATPVCKSEMDTNHENRYKPPSSPGTTLPYRGRHAECTSRFRTARASRPCSSETGSSRPWRGDAKPSSPRQLAAFAGCARYGAQLALMAAIRRGRPPSYAYRLNPVSFLNASRQLFQGVTTTACGRATRLPTHSNSNPRPGPENSVPGC